MKFHPEGTSSKESEAVVVKSGASFLFLVFVRFLASSPSSSPNLSWIATSTQAANGSLEQDNAELLLEFAGSSAIPIWEHTKSSPTTLEERVGATRRMKSNVQLSPSMIFVNFERNESRSASIRRDDDSSYDLKPSLLLSEDDNSTPLLFTAPETAALIVEDKAPVVAVLQQKQKKKQKQKQVSRGSRMSRIIVPVMIEVSALFIPGLPTIIRLLNHTRQGRCIKARARKLLLHVAKAGSKIFQQAMTLVNKSIFLRSSTATRMARTSATFITK
jgi:hypothetical protein